MTSYKPTELTLAQSLQKVSYEPRPAPYPMRLDVPFSDKDQVKALGAKWNATVRAWFVPADKDLNKFTRWMPYNPGFEGQTALAESIMHDDREILRVLAK